MSWEERMYEDIERRARRRRIERYSRVIERYWLVITFVVLVTLFFLKGR